MAGPDERTNEKTDEIEKYTDALEHPGENWLQVNDWLNDRESRQNQIRTFFTGWQEFDSAFGGLALGEFTVVSGIEGNGKSLWCKSFVHHLVRNNTGVGYISYEGNQYYTFKPFEYDGNFKLYIPKDLKAGDPDWIIKQCARLKAAYLCDVIILDHLHYIVDMNTRQNLSINIGAAIRKFIKEICQDLNLHVVLVAHQQNLNTSKTEPGIDTVRDSSFIRQEPDNFITVHRIPDPSEIKGSQKTYDQGYAMVKIDKARRQGTFRRKITFQKAGDWLEEWGNRVDTW